MICSLLSKIKKEKFKLKIRYKILSNNYLIIKKI